MITTRVIPCLLIEGTRLVKTRQFGTPRYLGDPRNAVRIFNEKEVDELVLLDISASKNRTEPQFDLIEEIVSEAFMPVAYGGGISTLDQARRVIQIGVEKVILCSNALENPALIEECSREIGNQSVVVCIDVRKSAQGYELFSHAGTKRHELSVVDAAIRAEKLGAGEIVVNSIDRDGMMDGYDLNLLRSITDAITVPVVACGGAGKIQDFVEAVDQAKVSAVAAGSLFVYYGKFNAVLINYPDRQELEPVLSLSR